MRNIGFPNAHRHSYRYEMITQMLDNGCPVIIYAMPHLNIFLSHAWLIDGYKIKERTETITTYYGGKVTDERRIKQSVKMVHCDFGWKGSCNGYYTSGIFHLGNKDVERDNPNDKGRSRHYNNHIKIITYDRPY